MKKIIALSVALFALPLHLVAEKTIISSFIQVVEDQNFIPKASLVVQAQEAEKLFFAARQQDLTAESRWRYLPTQRLNTNTCALGAYSALRTIPGVFLGTYASAMYVVQNKVNKILQGRRACDIDGYDLDNYNDHGAGSVRSELSCLGLYLSYHMMNSSLSGLTSLQERLIICADFLRVAQDVADQTKSDAIARLCNSDDKEVVQLMQLLQSSTFKGKSSTFSNWGAILVAHNLFEKHKQVFDPVVEMVNEFVAASKQ